MTTRQMAQLVTLAAEAIASADLSKRTAQRKIEDAAQTKEGIIDTLVFGDGHWSRSQMEEAAERLIRDRGFYFPLASREELEKLGRLQLRYVARAISLWGSVHYSWQIYLLKNGRLAADVTNITRSYGEALAEAAELVKLEVERGMIHYTSVVYEMKTDEFGEPLVEVGYRVNSHPSPFMCFVIRRMQHRN